MVYTLEFLNSYSTNSEVLLGFLTAACLTIFMKLLKGRSKIYYKLIKNSEGLSIEKVTPDFQKIVLLVLLILFSVLTLNLIKSSLYTLDAFSQIQLTEESKDVVCGGVIWTETAIATYKHAWHSYYLTVKLLQCLIPAFPIVSLFLYIFPMFRIKWLLERNQKPNQ